MKQKSLKNKYQLTLSLKKLSITDEQLEQLQALLSKKIKKGKIAKELGVSRITLWRNLVLLGANKKASKKIEQKTNSKCFQWSDFNNTVI